MQSNQSFRVSGGRLALSIVLALLLGALTPILTVLEASLLMPVTVLGGVFMVFLHCFAGPIPAWLFMTVQLACSAAFVGDTFMWMQMAAGSVPALIAIRGILLRRPFFEQLRVSVILYTVGMVAALFVAYTRFGAGMIGRATDSLLQQFDRMPDAFFTPFVDALNRALSASGITGVPTVTVSAYRDQIVGILSLARQTYEIALPGALLSGAALSGVLSTLWGGWLLARRGLATNGSYVPIGRWYLPVGVTLGLTGLWLVTTIMEEAGYVSGASISEAAYDLAALAFFFQAIGAVDRFFHRRGTPDRSRRRRVILVAAMGALIPVFNIAMFVLGMGSALFGSHGALRQWRDRAGRNP